MATNIIMSLFTLVSLIKPSAFADNLMSCNKMGKMVGKLKMAMSVALLLAFAAMPDINVNVMAKPILDNKMAIENCQISFTGLPATKLKTKNVKVLSNKSNKILYKILAVITAIGSANW